MCRISEYLMFNVFIQIYNFSKAQSSWIQKQLLKNNNRRPTQQIFFTNSNMESRSYK